MTAEAGHNSGVAAAELRQFVERIERIEDEISLLLTDRKLVYIEAKDRGYDTKTLRRIVKTRKADAEKLAEQQALLETYGAALGIDVFA